MQRAALSGYANVALHVPFVQQKKSDIVVAGARAGTPLSRRHGPATRGGEVHCGRCGTCVERREAFHLAGVEDPTAYADPDFWRSATRGEGQG